MANREQTFKYLSYPQPVLVVCTYGRGRKPNLMTVLLGGM
jgi:flavin reductase (DIM6/NTAB) family NADH-FMN oxidoreductase RutF